jgi:hypothetical protein
MIGNDLSPKLLFELANLRSQLKAERAKTAKLEALYRWRPISEMHEDYGPCVCINLIEDPCYLEIHWANDAGFEESAWTHFAQCPKLSTDDAEQLLAALQAPKVKP